jgi:hypothetical protein
MIAAQTDYWLTYDNNDHNLLNKSAYTITILQLLLAKPRSWQYDCARAHPSH